jgi:hypothetical protein
MMVHFFDRLLGKNNYIILDVTEEQQRMAIYNRFKASTLPIDSVLKWREFLVAHDDVILKRLHGKYDGNPAECARHFSSDSCAKDIQHIDALLADIRLPVERD